MAIRFAVAGLTHGHVWGLIDRWAAVEEVELTAVADQTKLLDKVAGRFQRTYGDWREMLDKEQIDCLLVTSNSLESSEIVIAALAKGIPCVKEKPMAVSGVDADRMLNAQSQSGKLLMINWPIAWRPAYHALKTELAKGTIGHSFHARMRMGHWGPKEIGCEAEFVEWLYDERLNGGGAIADFCGYGAVVSRWLFGLPDTVFCIRDNFTKDYAISDDHAICLLRYPKATVQIEGTWATKGFDDGPSAVVHGSEGTLAIYGEKRLVLHTPGEAKEIDLPTLPEPDPASYFLSCMRTARKPEGILDPIVAADACRIIDAAKKSAGSGCAEKLLS